MINNINKLKLVNLLIKIILIIIIILMKLIINDLKNCIRNPLLDNKNFKIIL